MYGGMEAKSKYVFSYKDFSLIPLVILFVCFGAETNHVALAALILPMFMRLELREISLPALKC